jgi:protein disulfide-isomerase A6
MCDELGDEETMQAYVEEAGSTSLCSVVTGSGCSEKESGFIEKWKAKGKEDAAKDLSRLQGMTSNSMKPELKKWLKQRIGILKQLSAGGKEEL